MHCSNCGFQNDGGKFCANCGVTLNQSNQGGSKPLAENYSGQYRGNSGNYNSRITVAQRSFWKYILPSFIMGGLSFILIPGLILSGFEDWNTIILITIFFALGGLISGVVLLIYYYHNFNDFKMMIQKYHPEIYTGYQDPLIMLGVYFVFSPVVIYFKYQQLYDHLTKVHQQQNQLPPSPIQVFAVILSPVILVFLSFIAIPLTGGLEIGFMIFAGLAVVISLGSAIAYFYMENRWQKAFNLHVQWHH